MHSTSLALNARWLATSPTWWATLSRRWQSSRTCCASDGHCAEGWVAVLRMSRGLKNEKQICSLSEKTNRVSHASLLSHFFGAQDQLGEGGPRACAESLIADASVEATAVSSPAPTPMGCFPERGSRSFTSSSPNSPVLAFNCFVTEFNASPPPVQHLRSHSLCGHLVRWRAIQAHSYPIAGEDSLLP